MTDGTAGRADIQANLASALRTRLRGHQCRFYGSDLRFPGAEGHIRYPDGVIVCSPLARTASVVCDPIVVFETLGPGATHKDRIVKASEYQATPPARRDLMLEQDGATLCARSGDACRHDILVADSILALPEIGVEFFLAELYEGIDFEEEPDATVG